VQTVGQVPQWSLSDFKSTHAPPQSVYPKLQAMPQPAVVQVALPLAMPAQILPQTPQFLVSESSLTQAPLHGL
jgi:hypothetical protein